jgi:sialic acid synthase
MLVAAHDLAAGHVLGEGDIVARSPVDGGLAPYELDSLLGRTLERALAEDEPVTHDALVPLDEPVVRAAS